LRIIFFAVDTVFRSTVKRCRRLSTSDTESYISVASWAPLISTGGPSWGYRPAAVATAAAAAVAALCVTDVTEEFPMRTVSPRVAAPTQGRRAAGQLNRILAAKSMCCRWGGIIAASAPECVGPPNDICSRLDSPKSRWRCGMRQVCGCGRRCTQDWHTACHVFWMACRRDPTPGIKVGGNAAPRPSISAVWRSRALESAFSLWGRTFPGRKDMFMNGNARSWAAIN